MSASSLLSSDFQPSGSYVTSRAVPMHFPYDFSVANNLASKLTGG